MATTFNPAFSLHNVSISNSTAATSTYYQTFAQMFPGNTESLTDITFSYYSSSGSYMNSHTCTVVFVNDAHTVIGSTTYCQTGGSSSTTNTYALAVPVAATGIKVFYYYQQSSGSHNFQLSVSSATFSNNNLALWSDLATKKVCLDYYSTNYRQDAVIGFFPALPTGTAFEKDVYYIFNFDNPKNTSTYFLANGIITALTPYATISSVKAYKINKDTLVEMSPLTLKSSDSYKVTVAAGNNCLAVRLHITGTTTSACPVLNIDGSGLVTGGLTADKHYIGGSFIADKNYASGSLCTSAAKMTDLIYFTPRGITTGSFAASAGDVICYQSPSNAEIRTSYYTLNEPLATIPISITVDVTRKAAKAAAITSDSKRPVVVSVGIMLDTERKLPPAGIETSITIDTHRAARKDWILESDTVRGPTIVNKTTTLDSKRSVSKPDSISADTKRQTCLMYDTQVVLDTARTFKGKIYDLATGAYTTDGYVQNTSKPAWYPTKPGSATVTFGTSWLSGGAVSQYVNADGYLINRITVAGSNATFQCSASEYLYMTAKLVSGSVKMYRSGNIDVAIPTDALTRIYLGQCSGTSVTFSGTGVVDILSMERRTSTKSGYTITGTLYTDPVDISLDGDNTVYDLTSVETLCGANYITYSYWNGTSYIAMPSGSIVKRSDISGNQLKFSMYMYSAVGGASNPAFPLILTGFTVARGKVTLIETLLTLDTKRRSGVQGNLAADSRRSLRKQSTFSVDTLRTMAGVIFDADSSPVITAYMASSSSNGDLTWYPTAVTGEGEIHGTLSSQPIDVSGDNINTIYTFVHSDDEVSNPLHVIDYYVIQSGVYTNLGNLSTPLRKIDLTSDTIQFRVNMHTTAATPPHLYQFAVGKKIGNTDFIETTLAIDSGRKISKSASTTSDTSRKQTASRTVSTDTRRRHSGAVSAVADLYRRIGTAASSAADALRRKSAVVSQPTDTRRALSESGGLSPDLTRRTTIDCTEIPDTKRRMAAEESNTGNLERRISHKYDIVSDSIRSTAKKCDTGSDLTRRTQIDCVALSETKRRTAYPDMLLIDLERSISSHYEITSNLNRRVSKDESSESDLTRAIVSASSVTAGTDRRISAAETLQSNLERRTGSEAHIGSDLKRTTTSGTTLHVDVERRTTALTEALADTSRRFMMELAIIAYIDTERKASNSNCIDSNLFRTVHTGGDIQADSIRYTRQDICAAFDTKRSAVKEEKAASDSGRSIISAGYFASDSERRTGAAEIVPLDTRRRIKGFYENLSHMDAERKVTNGTAVTIDTRRAKLNSVSYATDTIRNTKVTDRTASDLLRQYQVYINESNDTRRKTADNDSMVLDTSISKIGGSTYIFDTLRFAVDSSPKMVDAERTVRAAETMLIDTLRIKGNPDGFTIDTTRKTGTSKEIMPDTMRLIGGQDSTRIDTSRKTKAPYSTVFDTKKTYCFDDSTEFDTTRTIRDILTLDTRRSVINSIPVTTLEVIFGAPAEGIVIFPDDTEITVAFPDDTVTTLF